MPVNGLKRMIESLPGEQFTQCWAAIEAIDGALNAAGPTGLLALNYIRAQHEERVGQLIGMQKARIAQLEADVREDNETLSANVREFAALRTAYEKAAKKLAKLKKKSKR